MEPAGPGVSESRLAAALERLDPGSRALLDLSLRRGLPDDELAQVLSIGPAEVAERRAAALARLADELGLHAGEDVDRLRDLVAMGGSADRQAQPPPVLERPRRRRPSRALVVVVAAAALLAAAGVVIAVVDSDDDDGKDRAERTATTGNGERPRATEERLEPVAGAPEGARAEAGVTGTGNDRRLELRVSGLPTPAGGEYGVWLYTSLAEAKGLADFNRGSFDLETRLPDDAGDYRFLDVSLEPDDANVNHSGDSVLRVPMSELLRR